MDHDGPDVDRDYNDDVGGVQVKRILRPGGMFIVREHDASAELIPMLDLAHSVFNAVMPIIAS